MTLFFIQLIRDISKGDNTMKLFTKMVLTIGFVILICLACGKNEKVSDESSTEYIASDVRNRNLKTAIEDYNNSFFKASLTSIDAARGDKLRDEDLVVLKELEEKIAKKTQEALKELDSLAVKEELHLFDFKFNNINKNYDISSFRPQVESLKAKYLKRVKSENDAHLQNYFIQIKLLKDITDQSSEGSTRVYYSKTNSLRLVAKIDGYKQPELFLNFYPSQLEPELETAKFTSSDLEIAFDKSSLLISDYNLSESKIITFNLLDNQSQINLDIFRKILINGNLSIRLKWFYEPEIVNVTSQTLKALNQVLTIYDDIMKEYKANIDNIYVPKHVK